MQTGLAILALGLSENIRKAMTSWKPRPPIRDYWSRQHIGFHPHTRHTLAKRWKLDKEIKRKKGEK